MTEVIKKGLNAPTDQKESSIKDWSFSKTPRKKRGGRKIIKAKEAVFTSDLKEISQSNRTPDTPMIKPLRQGLFVEGVEIVCRCGEKMVIHFDYEDDG